MVIKGCRGAKAQYCLRSTQGMGQSRSDAYRDIGHVTEALRAHSTSCLGGSLGDGPKEATDVLGGELVSVGDHGYRRWASHCLTEDVDASEPLIEMRMGGAGDFSHLVAHLQRHLPQLAGVPTECGHGQCMSL